MIRYRASRLLALRPPLAFGGHVFRVAPPVAQCLRCHAVLPVHALHEGQWLVHIGRWCPALLRAIET